MASSIDRLHANTAPEVNERIEDETKNSVLQHAAQGEPAISHRIEELNTEWDVDRSLMALAASNVLLGLVLGTTVNRKWLIFPAVVGGFLLLHAVRGWCPPLVAFRRGGTRTLNEINEEKYALKALRGDFNNVLDGNDATDQARAAWESVKA